MTFRNVLVMLALWAVCACGGGSDRSSTAPPVQSDTPPDIATTPNSAPVAVNDFASVGSNGASVSVSVLNNDSDVDGDSLSILFTGRPSHGTVSVDNNATPSFSADDRLIYTANSGFVGTDVFSYTVTDGRDGRANGYVTLVVSSSGAAASNPVNQKPVANSDAATTEAPAAVAIDVLANDTDPEAQELSLFGFSGAANGSVSVDDNGTPAVPNDDRLVYVPNSGFVGNDALNYSVTDGIDVVTGSVNVQVTAPGQPAAVPGEVCGIVTLGPVNGASIALYEFDDKGEPQGNPLAQTQTDPNGRWCVVLPEDRPDLLVESRGGVFPDPSDSRYERGAARLIAIADQLALQTLLPQDADFAALTVFSNAVLRKSRAEISGENFATVFAGNRNQALAAFGLDLFTTDVADPVLPAEGASQDSQSYAMAVGAAATSLNQIAVDLDVAAPNYILIDALIRDLSECRLNGRDQNGPVQVSVGGQSRPISSNIDLNLQILRFRNNLTQTYSAVPLLQVDQPVCEQVVVALDTTAPSFVQIPNNLLVTAPVGSDVAIGNALVQQFLAGSVAEDDRDASVNVEVSLSDGSALPATFGLGSTAIQFSATDVAGNSALPVIRFIEVSPAGPPQSFSDRVSTQEDTAVVVDVLANDVAQDNPLDPASVRIELPAQFGSASVDPLSGAVSYAPLANRNGTDRFRYSVADTAGVRSDSVTVQIDVTAQNDAPVAFEDVVSTPGSQSLIIAVLANDSDVEGGLDFGSLQLTSAPLSGMAVVDFVTGTVVYSPQPGFTGSDTFAYRVADEDGALSQVTTVTVEVLDPGVTPDSAPVSVNDLATVVEDTTTLLDVLANDTDVGGALDPSTLVVLSQPANGSLSVSAVNGEISYTPNRNFFGTDTFSYQVADNTGQVSAPATVFVNVLPQNDQPLAQNDIAQSTEDSVVRVSVLENDSDVDGLAGAVVTVVEQPTSGSAVWDEATAELVYTPDTGFNGSDTFSYQVQDADGLLSVPATVTINLTGLNDAPVATEDSFSVQSGQPSALDVLANDVDVDSPLVASAITILNDPANGSVNVDLATGRLIYTSTTAFVGVDQFSYRVSDPGGAQSNEVNVSLDVEAATVAPVAVDDAANALEQTAVIISVLDNDTDEDGDLSPATVQIVSPPGSGSTFVNANGQITYTSIDEFSGADAFSYSVADSEGSRSNTAVVTVTVSAVSEAPVASDDSATTTEDTSIDIDVVANDSDPENDIDRTSVVVTTVAQNGSVSVDPAGRVTYTPNADYAGTDAFAYSVSDSTGLVSNSAVVTVTVSGVNDAPLAVADSVTTNEDTPVTIAVLGNDSDVDSALDNASLVLDVLPAQGTATVDSVNGTVLYTPAANFAGNDTFEYQVSDAQGSVSNRALVTVTVTAVNDLPTAVDDVATTDEDVEIVVAVTSNDSDLDGTLDASSVAVVSLPVQGVAVVDLISGEIRYTPQANFSGQDVFTYRVSDDEGGVSNDAQVTVTVSPVNDIPVANNDVAFTDENVAVTVNVVQNDTDADGAADLVSVQIVDMPSSGSIVQGGTFAELVYTPDTNSNGNDQFSYLVQDASGEQSNTATVSITVALQPSSPTVLDRSASTVNDSSVDILVLLGASDPEDDIASSTVALVSQATQGVATVLPDGQVRYTPNPGYIGLDQFSFTVEDSTSLISNTGTVTVSVTAPNTGPVATNVDSILVFSGNSPSIDLNAAITDADGTVDFGTLIVGNESVGSATVQGATGVVDFAIPADFVGEASFEFSANDNDGLSSNTAQVFVTVWPAEDQDLDGVAEELENTIGTDPNLADSVYVHIDPDTPATTPDGLSWTTAYPTLGAAVADGKIESVPGNFTYVLMATNTETTTLAQEWQLSKTSNCDNLIFVGSLDPFVATPRRFDGGSTRTKFETVQTGNRPLELANCSNVQFHYIDMFGGSNVNRGGGVNIANSTVILNNVYVRNNEAIRTGGGIYLNDSGGTPSTLTLEFSTVRSNTLSPDNDSDSRGGGLFVANAGNLTVIDSIIRHNSAPVNGSVAASNTTGGGGMFVNNTPVYISGTAFSANRTGQCGGAIHLAGTQSMRVEHSNLSGNEAQNFGGGLCLRDSNANFTFHNNLVTLNYSDTGGGLYAVDVDKSRATNNTFVLNLANTSGGGVHLDPDADPVFSYNIAQFNSSNDVSDDVGGNVGQLASLDASYNFITSFFANFVGTDNSSQPIEFDNGYYQIQSSPGVNYGAIDSDDPLFALNLRYTDKSATTTDQGLLDAGYHYFDGERGSVNALQIVAPDGLVDNADDQRIWLAPLVNGTLLGAGHRLYVQSVEPSVDTHLYTLTDDNIDPLGTGSSSQLRDLGNGYYEVLLDIPNNLDEFEMTVYINSLTTPSFNLQIGQ